MTLLGKIMTFVVLILSIVFGVMGMMTYASHRNWKDYALDMKAKFDASEKVLGEAKSNNSKLELQIKQEKVSRAQAIANLYAERDILDTQIKNLLTERNNLRAQAGDLQERLAQSSARVLDLDQQIGKLRDEKIGLIDSIQFQQGQVVRLIDEIHSTDYTKETLRERAEQLARDIAEYERVMVAYKLDKNSLTDFIPPNVDGRITFVSRSKKGLVQISLGSNDGVKRGHQFDIMRGKIYVGRLELKEVDANTASGIVTLQEAPVRVDDIVTTKLLLRDKYSITANK